MEIAQTAEAAVARWREGLAALVAADPDLARIVAESGPPPLELREAGFPTLLRAIVAQQVSAASARAIWGRLGERCTALTPAGFLALGEADYRAVGFSRQKIAYGRGLAEAIVDGRLDLDGLHRMSDEEAVAALVQLKGFGRWTSEVYLMFALGRPDIWPADDLAVQVAVQKIKRLDTRPNRKAMDAIAEQWRPWRSVAAILMWHHYRNAP